MVSNGILPIKSAFLGNVFGGIYHRRHLHYMEMTHKNKKKVF